MNIRNFFMAETGEYIFEAMKESKADYIAKHPDNRLIDLGIGDVRVPPPADVVREMKGAARRLESRKTFRGYCEEGYMFLKQKIVQSYLEHGIKIEPDEVFITDGAKGALGDIFGVVGCSSVAIVTPTYPLYADLANMHGCKIVEFRGNKKNGFLPHPKTEEVVDVIFLCSPSNPTGVMVEGELLGEYISYAKKCGALIVFDAAYSAFAPGGFCSVFSNSGADECAVEVCSYSKSISFTGIRCGYMVVKKKNPVYACMKKYMTLRTNGVNYIAQCGAYGSYTQNSKQQIQSNVGYCRRNAQILKKPFLEKGIDCCGGENAPYVFAEVGCGESFFKELLFKKGVAVTPGKCFGAQEYARLSCFCTRREAYAAAVRIKDFLKDYH